MNDSKCWWTPPFTRVQVAPVIAFTGWCAFTWYLIAQALAGPVMIWNDSKAYVPVASQPLWSRAFLDGQRPPLFPLLIKIVGTSESLLVAQATIAAIAWGVLAWTVGRLIAHGWQRVAATWVILAFATALPVTLWNRSMLSESLAMSMLAMMFAGFIWSVRRLTWPRVFATTAACLGLAATKDALVWMVALLGIAVAANTIMSVGKGRALLLRTGVLAMCLFSVVALTEWGTLSSHRTNQDVSDVFCVRVFPFPSRVAWFAAHGMPEQTQIDAIAKATLTQFNTAKVVAPPPSDPSFAPLRRWLATKGTDDYLLWLATHPGYVITEPLYRPERAYNFFQGNLARYAATQNRMQSPLTIVMWPPLIGILALAAVATYFSVMSGVWRQRPWRIVLILVGIGVLEMLIAWHGDGQEVTRHTVEGLAAFRLGLWVVVTLGVLDPWNLNFANSTTQAVKAERVIGEDDTLIAEDMSSRQATAERLLPQNPQPEI